MTRNKRPTSTSAALPVASVKRMVTSLEIDAHPAFFGSSLARQNNGPEEEKDVYRWRGALYERQHHEPVHWVKAHDEREEAKRKKAVESKEKRAAALKRGTEKRKRDEKSLPPEPPRSHKKGKPRNLLAPTASKHQAITESNALVSKLLGLPPEIRNRIWCYVLGGRTVHILLRAHLRDTYILDHTCCKSHEDTLDVITNIRRADTLTEMQDYETTHDASCWGPARERLNLGVLSVCRQIHQEAALLPYQENTFVVAISALRDFLSSLMPAQSNAITSLVLYTEGTDHPYKEHRVSTETFNRRLSSLQEIYVLAYLGTTDYGYHPGLVDMWTRQFREYISLTPRLTLSLSVAVVAWYAKEKGWRGANRVDVTEWKAWSAKTEEQLKTPFDKAAVEKVREDKAKERTQRRQETRGARGLRALQA
ncbi:hypothetical protein LTR22_027897 [Elasticomyces elasticus]|nr:hypothetical protein LTR22_027897 [Elasticomyces elasticus]